MVPVHNILGFLVEMDWIGNQLLTEQEHEGVMNSLTRTDSDISTENDKCPRLQLQVCIPETIEEEGEESGEKSIVDVDHEEIVESKGNKVVKPSFPKRILQKLSSNDSYTGIDNTEVTSDIENNLDPSSPAVVSTDILPPRRSRLSRLFNLDFTRKESVEVNETNSGRLGATTRVKNTFFADFTSDSNKSILDDSDTMAEKFPGFKYRSQSSLINQTNETNLSVIEEMDDIPPQQVAPGRFTTLKQILGQDGISTSPMLGETGEIKGVKGTKIDFVMSNNNGMNNAITQSARARERCPDGVGAIIGGVLFEKLVVKKNEFSPRLLELRLREILPLFSRKGEKITTSTPLNTNKIIPFREVGLIAGNQQFLSYDGHLILDGVDFSRDKHVEVLIRVLDLPIEKSIELLQEWVSNSIESSSSDIPEHWEDFMANNILIFSQKVKEMKEYSQSTSSSSSSAITSGSFDPITLPPSPRHGHGVGLKPRSNHHVRKNELQHIQHLDLRYCQMTNRGVALLIDSLRKNTFLLSLNLTGNSISRDSTAASLGNLLNFNSTLVEVNLQETNLGNTGATLLAQALHINMVRILLHCYLITTSSHSKSFLSAGIISLPSVVLCYPWLWRKIQLFCTSISPEIVLASMERNG